MENKTIIFVCGAFHGEWCWNENFVPFFKNRGYEIKIHVLSDGAKNVEESIEKLKEITSKIKGEFTIISHSIGNLFVNEYLMKGHRKPASLVILNPYPVNKKFINAVRIAKRFFCLKNKELYFSNTKKDVNKYIDLLKKEEPSGIKSLTVCHKYNKSCVRGIPVLIIGSLNDKCIPLNSLLDTMKLYVGKLIIYRNVCHDSMLDSEWESIAGDIAEFI